MTKLPHRIIRPAENQEMMENHGWCMATIIEKEQGRHVKSIEMEENSSSLEMYHIRTKKTWFVINGSFEYRWVNQYTAQWEEKIIQEGDLIDHEPGQIHSIRILSESGVFIESANGDLNMDTLCLPVNRIGSISATI